MSLLPFISSIQIENNSIVFITEGSSFSPIINIEGGADVLWRFPGNITSNSTTPTVDFGSSATRRTELAVSPFSALQSINVGYDGDDGGSSSTVQPDLMDLLSQQNVSSITGLDKATNLLALMCSNNPITSIDLSNLLFLERFEAYNASLTTLTTALPSLKRLCIENNSITGTLDLGAMTDIEDIRAASNSFDSIIWPEEELSSLWHICIREMPNLDESDFPPMSQIPAISQLWISENNISGAYSLSGAFPEGRNGSVWLYGNPITEVDLTDCPGLIQANLRNMSLDQDAVDYVLITLAGYGYDGGGSYVYVNGNTAPSAAGLEAVDTLEGLGWTVLVSP